MLTPGEIMQAIAELGISIISDEIYHQLVYEEVEHSALEFTDNAFVLNGFSKAYAMTGWRLGYLIVPSSFVRPMQKIQQNFFICAPSFAQYAALAALKKAQPEVLKMRQIYNQRRLYLYKALKELGFSLKNTSSRSLLFLYQCQTSQSRQLYFSL
ncbi:MAG: Putative N-acetyl-LL-diaminopimelate aminotransferase [Candidatus Methanoperedenaceae archaeon GB50]|nr:MAG: Putative N-acetyl-LL-diaminopimelate aminotransferase [Candidatus Methanoperedenaceae archaeon GB50]